MTITIIAKNANNDFLKLVKSAAKIANVKLKIKKGKEVEKAQNYTLKTSPAIAKIRNIKLSDKKESQLKKEVLEECGLSNV